MFLYEDYSVLREHGNIAEVPAYIQDNLNPNFVLRPYQREAFENFITHYECESCPKPTQVLFHMATGSGKTLIMVGLMLYLYKHGYRNFLFFVNLSNIIEKMKENFLNSKSTKYLFAQEIVIDGERVRINVVDNFQNTDTDAINICFTTTQGLHTDMWMAKEGGMTLDDFDNNKVVLISDEAHHLNVDTRRMNIEETDSYHSWEGTVRNIFKRNNDNVLLEFTATCDLENKAIKDAYERKIVFDYALAKFYNDKYSKEILTLRSELSLMDRALLALVLSQYRLKVFQSYRLGIKPVILFKAAKIADSQDFMTQFIVVVTHLTGEQLDELINRIDNKIINEARKYFSEKGISYETLAMELRDDFSVEHCVSVNDDKEATQKQILLNSLEDADNPYRAIFEVRKLDEGWDVLNLFDIVRLYETRQSGGNRISSATLAEAQLIGRGARYCPFQLDDEQPMYQRKYDNDIENALRVCETLYYHCQSDSRYITELNQALNEIGLGRDKIVQREYKLKQSFKEDDLYKSGFVFLNERKIKDRKDVCGLMSKIKEDRYLYRVSTGASSTDEIMMGTSDDAYVDVKTVHRSIKEIASINYAIVNKALMKYPIFKFSTLRSYFPNLKSTRDFIAGDNYLGAINIEIQITDDEPSMEVLYSAVFYVAGKVAAAISEIKETYSGTTDFRAKYIHDVFRNKTVNFTEPHGDGVGISQNDSGVQNEWKIDLSREDWFAYDDNFGTSEEKAFVAYFKRHIDELKQNYDKIFLVRNEREFHIYSFDDGLRFEPDYVLFLQKNKDKRYEQWQIFIEPKGMHLLKKDVWKEDFLLHMKERAVPVKIFKDDNDYRIWGFHFYNANCQQGDFDNDFSSLMVNLHKR